MNLKSINGIKVSNHLGNHCLFPCLRSLVDFKLFEKPVTDAPSCFEITQKEFISVGTLAHKVHNAFSHYNVHTVVCLLSPTAGNY